MGYGYDDAKAVDTLERMIYGTSIDKHFAGQPTIKIVLRQFLTPRPKVFLFQAGEMMWPERNTRPF